MRLFARGTLLFTLGLGCLARIGPESLMGRRTTTPMKEFLFARNDADAFVLEAVYHDLDSAIRNRLFHYLGPLGPHFRWLLTWQVPVFFQGVAKDIFTILSISNGSADPDNPLIFLSIPF